MHKETSYTGINVDPVLKNSSAGDILGFANMMLYCTKGKTINSLVLRLKLPANIFTRKHL